MQTKTISVNQDVLAEKKRRAAEQRDAFTKRGTFVVNLVSSPGAGKTSLLQATARYWKGQFRIAVLVGDLATDRDAERLRPYLPVEQLTTGGACHLELSLVQQGLARLPPEPYDEGMVGLFLALSGQGVGRLTVEIDDFRVTEALGVEPHGKTATTWANSRRRADVSPYRHLDICRNRCDNLRVVESSMTLI